MSAAVMGLLANPNIALVVLFAGILLIYLECNRPGRVVPGCLGLLLVLCAGRAIAQFSLTAMEGLILLLGFGLLVAGIVSPFRGAMVVAAAGCLSLGLSGLIQPFGLVRVHPATAILVGTGFSGVTVWLARAALTARRIKRVLGRAESFCTPELPKVD